MNIVDIVTIILVGSVVYCYAIYPFAIQLYARFRKNPWKQDSAHTPSVSIVASIYNEEKVIGEFLDSLLSLNYPTGEYDIHIASDGSYDQTNTIVAAYAELHPHIKPHYFDAQRGKIPVLNEMVGQAKGEILFFVDADVTFSTNTLLAHTRHYADPTVGAVAGAYQVDDRTSNTVGKIESQYASLEQRMRTSEGQLASAMNVSGANYSMRQSLWKQFPSALACDDLYIVLSILQQGKRIVSDPDAIAYERHDRTLADEFPRKVRSASRGYLTLASFPQLLFARIPESLLLWSHKILRWLSPFFLLAAGLLSVWRFLETGNVFYGAYLLGLSALALIGSLAYFVERHGKSFPFFERIAWFAVMNYAFLVGAWKYLARTETSAWK